MARKKRRKKTKAIAAKDGSPSPLDAGLRAHQAGDLADAKALYLKALKTNPSDAGALHLLGVMAIQSGDFQSAIERIENAIAVNALVPAFHDHLGLALRQSGRPAEAEPHHRRALELNADFAPAHNNLAGTLLALNRFAEAEKQVRQALRLQPSETGARLNLGRILLAQNRPRAAIDVLEAIKRGQTESAETAMYLGRAYQGGGLREKAAASFRRATELAPKDARCRMELGTFHMAMEQFAEAADAFEKAAELVPGDLRATLNIGIARWRNNEFVAAKTAYHQVLEHMPEEPAALLGLAALKSAIGDADAAHSLYRQVLDADPGNLDAYNNLSTDGGAQLTNEDAERLGVILADTARSDDDRAKAGFALAGHVRRADAFEAAFDLYTTANEFRAAALEAMGSVYEPDVHDGFIEAREEVFSADFFAARRAMGSEDERPVFVVGMPRSGSTLIEQILASHPNVHGAGERREMATIGLQHLPEVLGGQIAYPQCLRALTADYAAVAAAQYLRAVADPKKARTIDKMPFNFMHLGLVALLFPKARIIHSRRHALDVALSCFFTNFADQHPWSTRLTTIAHYINAHDRMMAYWRDVLPTPILDVDYEKLVDDQENESRRMIDFLGLKWNATCLRFHETKRPVSTAARAQVRQPIYRASIDRWKPFEPWLGPLIAALGNGGKGPSHG